MFVGGAFGAAMLLAIVAVLFISPPVPLKPDISPDNANITAEPIPLHAQSLSLIEIFEKSEPGVVRVNVQRGDSELCYRWDRIRFCFCIKKVTS